MARLTYPDYETIVVYDGCDDDSATIARRHGTTVLETRHRGLSAARNAGALCAEGKIVAYLDDDAFPDPDWLNYIAAGLRDRRHGGVGGPNIPPEGGRTAECVAAAPGGPIHVLISDREAEHVPGCNMAFRKRALEEIGGFDERFRVAGDDVDLCWRLQEAGWRLGFQRRRCRLAPPPRLDPPLPAPAVRLRQGRGAVGGQVAAALQPRRLLALGGTDLRRPGERLAAPPPDASVTGPGGAGSSSRSTTRRRAASTGCCLRRSSFWCCSPCSMSPSSAPSGRRCCWRWCRCSVALAALLWRAVAGGIAAVPARPDHSRLETWRRRGLVSALFLLQPVARLAGRLRNGLSPWRRRLSPGAAWPRPRTIELWSEAWRASQVYLQALQDALAARGGYVRSGGPFDRWDLDLRAGPLGGVKMRTVVEEHGSGNQLLRLRIWPRVSAKGAGVLLVLAALTAWAFASGELVAGIAFARRWFSPSASESGLRDRDEPRPLRARSRGGDDAEAAGGTGEPEPAAAEPPG